MNMKWFPIAEVTLIELHEKCIREKKINAWSSNRKNEGGQGKVGERESVNQDSKKSLKH